MNIKNGQDRVTLFGIEMDNLSMNETLHLIEQNILENKTLHYADLNADKVVTLQNDSFLKKIYEDTDIINADGKSIIWAANILGKPLKERVTGIDLMQQLMKLAYNKGFKVYFLGATQEVVSAVVAHYAQLYSPDVIAGYRNGYFTEEEEPLISKEINESGAQILFVGISSPKKEIFLHHNKAFLNHVNFIMGVGGSFDVVAGKVKRAPMWMQNSGLEWFYRMMQEPKRLWKRYLIGNSRFLILLMNAVIKKQK